MSDYTKVLKTVIDAAEKSAETYILDERIRIINADIFIQELRQALKDDAGEGGEQNV